MFGLKAKPQEQKNGSRAVSTIPPAVIVESDPVSAAAFTPTVHAQSQPAASPVGSYTREPIPAGFDLRDLEKRLAVEARIRARMGAKVQTLAGQDATLIRSERAEGAVIVWPDDPAEGLLVLDTRPGFSFRVATAEVRATQGSQQAARLEEDGLTLVEWKPNHGYYIAARLDHRTKAVRKSFSQLAGCDPWDIELALMLSELDDGTVYVSQIHVTRSPVLEPEKRKSIWLQRVRDVLPPEDRHVWAFQQGSEPGRFVLTQTVDRLDRILDYPWDAPVDYAHIPFGMTEDGKPLTLGLIEVNWLLGGTPGGGKSGGLTTFLAGVSRLPHVALVGLDPKRVELALWKPRFSMIAREDDHATAVLEALVEEMERRYQWLEEHGFKKFTAAMLSQEHPLLVIPIDELADLVSVAGDPEGKKQETLRSTHIRRLIAKGRAAGIVVVTATQKPQSDVIPTALRDLIQLRVGYATTNAAMTDTILGAGMSGQGGLSHEIPAYLRGVCFVVNETSRTPVRARTYWIADEEVAGLAEKTAHLRVDLPWLPSEDDVKEKKAEKKSGKEETA